MSPLTLALFAVILIASAWGLRRLWHHGSVGEPAQIEITRHEVRLASLPIALDGLVLCQISDPHIAGAPRNRQAIAEAIRSVKADLYVITGDLVFGTEGPAAFLEWLDNLGPAAQPAIAIFGNAEYKPNVNAELLIDGLTRRDVPLLRNESLRFSVRGTELQIAGVDDPHTGLDDFAAAYREVSENEFVLLLAHSPDAMAHREGRRADLVLCGHTHGGQIRLGPLGPLRTNTHTVKGLVSGWYSGQELARRSNAAEDGTLLYISRGLGMNWIPLRLGCPPELAVLTLRIAEPCGGVSSANVIQET